MNDEDFWNLTPAELLALMDRWKEREDRKYLRAGTVAASAINPHLDLKKTSALSAFDIFPHLPQPAAVLPTANEAASNMFAFFQDIDKAKERKTRRRRTA